MTGAPEAGKALLSRKADLMAAFPYDIRAKRRHCLIYNFVVQWYHATYGDALLSVRKIVTEIKERDPEGVGLAQSLVSQTLNDIVSWGYLTQTYKGSGRAGSRYVPVWEPRSVHPVLNATENEISVHPVLNASVHPVLNATADSVHPVPNKDPLTQTRVLDTGTEKEGFDNAAPTAPACPPAGAGVQRVTALGGFAALWQAYGHRQKKADARKAWEALPADADLDAIITTATAWREAWAAQGKPDAPRKLLHTWLAAECWDEDPPKAYQPVEKPARAERPAKVKKPANDDKPAAASVPAGHNIPRGKAVRTIMSADVQTEDNSQWLLVTYDDGCTQRIAVSNNDTWIQQDGQNALRRIVEALDIQQLKDSDQLVGKTLVVEHDANGSILYAPAEKEAA